MLNRIGYILLACLVVGAMVAVGYELGKWKSKEDSQANSLKSEVVESKKQLEVAKAEILPASQAVTVAKEKATQKTSLVVKAREEVEKVVTDSLGVSKLANYTAAVDSALAAKDSVIAKQDTLIYKNAVVNQLGDKVIASQDKVIKDQNKKEKRYKLIIGGAVGATILVLILALI